MNSILALGQWYLAFLALTGCIIAFLILGCLLKAAFGSAPKTFDKAPQRDNSVEEGVQQVNKR